MLCDLALKLKEDVNYLGLPTDFILDLKGYSKIYNGRYDPNTFTIVLFTSEEDGTLINYVDLLRITVHEAIHHYQWTHDRNFVRYQGIMHDYKFKKIESELMERIDILYAKAKVCG